MTVTDRETLARYPPEAQKRIIAYAVLLEGLPVVLAASLLREVRGYDWQFPAERAELDAQLAFLAKPRSEKTQAMLQGFATLPLPPVAERPSWAAEPERFLEVFTANLWKTHAMDQFRASSDAYGEVLAEVRKGRGDSEEDRLVIVLIGRGAQTAKYPLFQKLREHGTYFSDVDTSYTMRDAVATLRRRASRVPGSFRHWYVDGAEADAEGVDEQISSISFGETAPVRAALKTRLQEELSHGVAGPETARTALMAMQPERVSGFREGESEIMKHFTVRVLSDGSGTQVFSTTFVQWTGREVLRRASPRTLLMRYAPRVNKLPQNLFESDHSVAMDAEGALRDADMGAYYTWLSLMRTPGAGPKVFIAIFEGGQEAVAIAPGLPTGTVSKRRVTTQQILGWAGA